MAEPATDEQAEAQAREWCEGLQSDGRKRGEDSARVWWIPQLLARIEAETKRADEAEEATRALAVGNGAVIDKANERIASLENERKIRDLQAELQAEKARADGLQDTVNLWRPYHRPCGEPDPNVEEIALQRERITALEAANRTLQANADEQKARADEFASEATRQEQNHELAQERIAALESDLATEKAINDAAKLLQSAQDERITALEEALGGLIGWSAMGDGERVAPDDPVWLMAGKIHHGEGEGASGG